MKKIIGLILLGACGFGQETYRITAGPVGTAGKNGKSCTVSTVSEGALISCDDGTSSLVKNGAEGDTGSQGVAGIAGVNGTNGTSCSVLTIAVGDPVAANGGSLITCGATTSLLLNGTNGANGVNGSNGSNGSNGTNGTNAVLPAYSVVQVVDPCGPQSSQDEVFLKLQNGMLVASFSDNTAGAYTHFAILTPGAGYMTTDHTGCYFSVDANGNLYNEHN